MRDGLWTLSDSGMYLLVRAFLLDILITLCISRDQLLHHCVSKEMHVSFPAVLNRYMLDYDLTTRQSCKNNLGVNGTLETCFQSSDPTIYYYVPCHQ
jgi:hypothetical protein